MLLERKCSLKDDLPDLTPYLSKKGGQNQGRAATPAQDSEQSEKPEAPPKADLSSKLSALIKKPGSTGTNVPALTAEDIARASAAPSAAPAQPLPSSEPQAPSSAQAPAIAEPQAPPPSVNSKLAVPPILNSPAKMAVPSSNFLSVPSNSWGGAVIGSQPQPQPQEPEVEPFDEEPPSMVADQGLEAEHFSQDNLNNDLLEAESFDTHLTEAEHADDQHGGGSFSGRLTSERPRPMISTASIDKFRAPQAKPLTTLSSAGAPVLKAPTPAPAPSTPTPAKMPPRVQPREYRPEPREGVVPRGPERSPQESNLRPQPGKSAPLQSGPMPGVIQPATSQPTYSAPPAPSTPQAPPAPAASPVARQSEPVPQTPKDEAQGGPRQNLSSSLFDDAPSRLEKPSEADMLARAFREEAKALADAGEQSTAEDVNKALYSDYDENEGRPLGFGNLLGDVEQSSVQHSALADLMVPTGEHQTLFERERKQIGEAFDEPVSSGPIRVSETAQAPAFSSLLSDEIVTSGHDYSQSSPAPTEAPAVSAQFHAGFDALEPAFNQDDRFSFEAKSDMLGNQDELIPPPAPDLTDFSQSSDFTQPSDFSPEPQTPAPAPEIASASPFARPKDEARQSKSMAIGKLLEAVNRSKQEDEPQAAAPELKEPVANASEADEVARILAQVEAPRHDDKEVSLDELKALLKKEKAAKKAAKLAEAQGQSAQSAPTEPVKPSEPAMEGSIQAQSGEKKTGLGALLGSSAPEAAQSEPSKSVEPAKPAPLKDEPEPIEGSIQDTLRKARLKAEAEQAALASGISPADDDYEPPTLGDAVADALDKLLTAPPSSEFGAGAALGSVGFAGAAGVAASTDVVEKAVEAASLALPPEPEPLTMTQSKVDALSRLLEVASKAPEKPTAEEKTRPSDSASKLAEMINKPQGRVSRQNPTLDPADYMKPQEGVSQPFGGSSPFTSPFATPASSMSNQPSMSSPNQSTQGTPAQGPQAPISTDAVSARIAALNRKLDEQRRPPTASMNSQAAMSSSNLSQLPPMGASSVPSGMGAMPMSSPPMANPSNPNIPGGQSSPSNSMGGMGSMSQNGMPGMPGMPGVPGMPGMPGSAEYSAMDEPASKSELVSRILGQAKLQMGATAEVRPMPPESVSVDQVQHMRAAKPKEKKGQRDLVRAKSMRPSMDPRILVGVVVVLILGVGGFFAYKSGLLKQEISTVSSIAAPKLTLDQYIKNGDFDKAREILEAKQKSLKITSSESEKLNSVYFSLAEKNAADGEEADAIKLLEKIPSKSKKYKDARKLLNKLKKKVKKN